VRLSSLKNFEVADGDPDVRNWDVRDAENNKIGKVAELIVDSEGMVVRYLEIALDREVAGTGDDRHVLIPIGFVTLAQYHDEVFLKNLPKDVLLNCPDYDGATITRDHELAVRKALVSDLIPPVHDFYAGQPFDISGFARPRPTSEEPNASHPDEII